MPAQASAQYITLDYGEYDGGNHYYWVVNTRSIVVTDTNLLRIDVAQKSDHGLLAGRKYYFQDNTSHNWKFFYVETLPGTRMSQSKLKPVSSDKLANDVLYILLSNYK